MARSPLLSTRVLLICAAIGVATGLLQAIGGVVSAPVSAFVPILYGLVLGVHVLPGVIAQELLRLPLVAIATHLVAALVASAFTPQWIGRYLGTALLIGALQEGIAALTRYRRWEPWRLFVSAVIVGVILAIPIALVADLAKFAPWAQVVYLAMFVIGPVLWTAVGIAVGVALRRTGVGRVRR